MKQRSSALNGAELSLVNMRLEGIVRKMSSTLLRTGRSGVLNRARDFSCCIVTPDNELLASAESLPIHVLSGPDMMTEYVSSIHPDFKKGDAFLHNSPYHGCSHPADHTIIVPVIDGAGIHRFWVLAKAHQADIGNSLPTTYMSSAADVYEEGALIFPGTRVRQDNLLNSDIIRMCKLRIRVPEQWHGDFLAMIAAANTGEKELLSLGEELGWDALQSFSTQWLDYGELRMAEVLRGLPESDSSSTIYHDAMPGVADSRIPITAHVKTRPQSGEIEVDLRNNPDCMPNGLNLSEACSRTAAMIGVFNSICSSVPKNAGSFRRIKIRLKEGCIAGIPSHPTSCSAATTNIADRVTNAVQLAISDIGDGLGMAEIGANLPPSRGVFSGVDPRSNKAFINQVFLGSSGGGASARADGWFHYSHAGNGGMGYLDSIEQAELYQPLIVWKRQIVPDTEGAGERAGAPSKLIEIEAACDRLSVAYGADGVTNGPRGARGGGRGGSAKQVLRRKGQTEDLPSAGVLKLRRHEVLVSVTCGGGGYGKPKNRDRAKVISDVENGLVSASRAKEVYGLKDSDLENIEVSAAGLAS